jgi:hypothetical protein
MEKENSTFVVTGLVRFSYCHVVEPQQNDDGTEKYNVCILIPKKDTKTLEKINKAVENAKIVGKSKLAGKSGKILPNIKLPLRDGEDKPDQPEFNGMMFFNASSNYKPAIVDINGDALMNPKEDFYSGCYGRVSVNFYAFDSNGNKGIAAGLNNIQKVRDGEKLAGASNPQQDFEGDNTYSTDDNFFDDLGDDSPSNDSMLD